MVSRRESVEIEIFEPKVSGNELVVAVEVTRPLIRAFPSRADTEARTFLECEQTAPAVQPDCEGEFQ